MGRHNPHWNAENMPSLTSGFCVVGYDLEVIACEVLGMAVVVVVCVKNEGRDAGDLMLGTEKCLSVGKSFHRHSFGTSKKSSASAVMEPMTELSTASLRR
jgi:hypothetical protein